ncbi:sensor histidine kinase [Amylibacter sp.]|nr:sensor histidine kinase [Amylibacter sp.]MDA9278698.1 sensor histidine kinase [Amylibacter sp.]MDA9771970.1 sensor histidine kinase [Amylibacter sp.]MDB4008923.1 sensor histidine kinase [Amylibacter sp.]
MTSELKVSGSLQNRLMLTLISGAAVLGIILFFIVRGYAAQIAQNGQDDILEASLSSILDAIVIQDGSIEVDFPYASLSMLDTELDDRVFYSIYNDDILISGYEDLPLPEKINAEISTFNTIKYKDTNARIASAKRILIGEKERITISVSIAQTQDALSRTLNRISKNVALFGSGFFILVTLLSYWATATTISPLMRLASSITKRGPQDLSPFEKKVPSEMYPLVTSLNKLMTRLDLSLKQSEDFIAEAAHRVRTPLATVRSYADATLQRVSKKENRDALRSMVRAIDEASRAASQLLDHAMITFRSDNLQKEPINLNDLVQNLIDNLTPIAEMKDIELKFKQEDKIKLYGDFILIQNAIRNLIDNALKYSPYEGIITVSIGTSPISFLEIHDQGPGFPPKDLDNLTMRFTRGQNSNGIVGSGLGLTIAKDVANAHGAKLQLSNHEKGGACVTLLF